MKKTQVSNVRVKYIRPKYKDLKDWCEDPDNVYIGRRGVVYIQGERYPKKDSLFANPYKNGSREEVISLYEKYLINKIKLGEITLEQLLSLKGKNLGCWCHPLPCHGDVLLRIIEAL